MIAAAIAVFRSWPEAVSFRNFSTGAATAILIASGGPAQAGGYVMPVTEIFFSAPAPAAAAPQAVGLCGDRPELCLLALLLLAALAGSLSGGDGDAPIRPVDGPDPLPEPPGGPVVCMASIQLTCEPGTPVTPGNPDSHVPPVAPVPLPAGLPLAAAGLGMLAMLRRRRHAQDLAR